MNRHQRRVARKKGDPRDLRDLQPPSMTTRTGFDHRGASDDASQRATPPFLLRALSKILLSPWVLDRVRHPEAERLLTVLASEVGRTDAVDALVRRRGTRERGVS